MERMTRLRAIRLKYGISLVELERHSRVSNQYLSALELGNVSRTANNEEVLGCAIDEIIRSRKSSLLGLAPFRLYGSQPTIILYLCRPHSTRMPLTTPAVRHICGTRQKAVVPPRACAFPVPAGAEWE